MSKGSMIMMAILLVAFGSMLLAAELMMGPIEEDLTLARELAALLDHRGWLAEDKPKPDNRVRVRSVKGGTQGRMSKIPDWGVIVEIRPSITTLTTKDRMGYLAAAVLERIEEEGRRGRVYHWVELVILADEGQPVVRTLIDRVEGGWVAAEPPIPATWTPATDPGVAPDSALPAGASRPNDDAGRDAEKGLGTG